jgi:hypothetical protein
MQACGPCASCGSWARRGACAGIRGECGGWRSWAGLLGRCAGQAWRVRRHGAAERAQPHVHVTVTGAAVPSSRSSRDTRQACHVTRHHARAPHLPPVPATRCVGACASRVPTQAGLPDTACPATPLAPPADCSPGPTVPGEAGPSRHAGSIRPAARKKRLSGSRPRVARRHRPPSHPPACRPPSPPAPPLRRTTAGARDC